MMKIPFSILVAVLGACSFALSSCGNKKEDKEVENDGPQTREGKILEAAKKAADKANAKSFELDKYKGIDGK